MTVGANSVTQVGYGIALWFVLVLIPGVITWLKGQRAAFFVGLVLAGLVWWVAALRLARPESYWARRFYGEKKLARANRRHGGLGTPTERVEGGVPGDDAGGR